MRVTVVGDTLLDQDYEGESTRRSPDSGAPVVDVSQRTRRAGGAGLVANMLAGDGHDVVLVTALADDDAAAHVRRGLGGIEIIAGASHAPTPVKTRLRSNGQPFARLDEGCGEPPQPQITAAMLDAIASAELIVVADYGRGMLAHPRVRDALERRGTEAPLVWDPHPRGAVPVGSARLVTPNLAEATAFAGLATDADAEATAALLHDRWGCGAVVITLGESGALLRDDTGTASRIPARAVADADPCGAGDRFAATAAVTLAETGDLRAAVSTAVDAAAAYLAAGGVAALADAESGEPDPGGEPAPVDADPASLIQAVRARGGTVVATGGCFDLLHAGHVRTLQAARDLGDCLIVCLNSDESVRRLKGPTRPIIGEQDRTELLRALACVDAVLVFEEDSPETALAELRPDVWVKGGDYSADALPETRLMKQWGGRTVTLPYHLGRSTTALAAALAAVV